MDNYEQYREASPMIQAIEAGDEAALRAAFDAGERLGEPEIRAARIEYINGFKTDPMRKMYAGVKNPSDTLFYFSSNGAPGSASISLWLGLNLGRRSTPHWMAALELLAESGRIDDPMSIPTKQGSADGSPEAAGGWRLLHKACKAGLPGAVASVLAAGASPNGCRSDENWKSDQPKGSIGRKIREAPMSETPLQVAAKSGCLEAFDMLVAAGADQDAKGFGEPESAWSLRWRAARGAHGSASEAFACAAAFAARGEALPESVGAVCPPSANSGACAAWLLDKSKEFGRARLAPSLFGLAKSPWRALREACANGDPRELARSCKALGSKTMLGASSAVFALGALLDPRGTSTGLGALGRDERLSELGALLGSTAPEALRARCPELGASAAHAAAAVLDGQARWDWIAPSLAADSEYSGSSSPLMWALSELSAKTLSASDMRLEGCAPDRAPGALSLCVSRGLWPQAIALSEAGWDPDAGRHGGMSARERALELLRETGGDSEVRELMSCWEREAISCAAPENSVAASKRL